MRSLVSPIELPPQGRRGPIGPEGPAGRDATGEAFTLPVVIASIGQTAIPLPSPPTRLSSVTLTVNGIAYRVPNISSSDVVVTWLNPDFALAPTDDVILTYA